MNPIEDSNLISTKDASELSGYSADYLSKLARAKKISGTQVGRNWLVNRDSLVAFIEAQRRHKKELARELARVRASEYRANAKPAVVAPVMRAPQLDASRIEEALISTKDAAELSGYSTDYLAKLARDGKVKGVQIAGAWLLDRDALAAFMSFASERKAEIANALSRTRSAQYRANLRAVRGASYPSASSYSAVLGVLVVMLGFGIAFAAPEAVPPRTTAAAADATQDRGFESVAVMTYDTLHDWFLSMRRGTYAYFDRGPSVLVISSSTAPAEPEEEEPATVNVINLNFSSSTPHAPQAQGPVVLGGVSQGYLSSRLASFRTDLMTELTATIQPKVFNYYYEKHEHTGGGGGGSSSVTSIDASGGTTGLSFTGGPITNSGTLTLSGTLDVGAGGTGLSSAPTYGQLLMGDGLGGYDLVATSSLGITAGSAAWGAITGTLSDQTDLQAALDAKLSLTAWYATTTDGLDEGVANLYYADSRVGTYLSTLDKGFFFSTTSADYYISQAGISSAFSTTSANYWKSVNDFFSTTSANYWETTQVARTADDLTDNSIEDLSDVAAMTENFGDLLYWNGTAWSDVATSSLGLPTFSSLASYLTLADWYATTTDGLDEGIANLYYTDARVGTYLSTLNKGFFFSTTSADYWKSVNNFYSTTSADYWLATKSTTDLAEGSNLYWTNDRFDGRLAATTTLPNLTTLANLSTVGTITSGTWQGSAIADTYVADNLTISGGTIDNTPIGAASASTAVFTNATSTSATTTNLYASGSIRGAGLTACAASGDKLLWNATTGQFSCGSDAGAGGGITALGAQYSSFQTGSSQTFATSSDTNIGLVITSSADTHTFTPTWIGTLAVGRGGTGSTTLSGILKGNGTGAVQTAVAGTDYVASVTGDWTGTFDGQEGSYYLANSFSTTSADYWKTQNDFFSTTSAFYHLGTLDKGFFFSTTSAAFWETTQVARTADDLSDNSIEDLSDVAAMTENYGDFLGWNGSTWTDFATSSLGIALSDTLGTLGVSRGGTGATSFSYGLIYSPGGTSALANIATSSLGLLTTHVAEGTNLYYTDARVNAYIHASTTIPKTYSANTFTALQSFSNASSTYFSSSYASSTNALFGNLSIDSLTGPLQAIGGVVSATSSISQVFGGTGINSYTAGDILYADSTGTLAKLPVGSAGQVLKVTGGLPAWGVDLTTGGGGGAGAWSTTTNDLAIYPTDTSYVVIVGNSATSTASSIFEVAGRSYFSNTVGIATTAPSSAYKLSVQGDGLFSGSVSLANLTATGTVSTTNLSATNATTTSLGINSETFTDLTGTGLQNLAGVLTLNATGDWTGTLDGQEGSYYLANSFSTTSADYWKTQNDFFSTTSAAFWETTQVARTADDLSDNSIEDLSDVASMTENYGDLLFWNGTSWADIATSSLGLSGISFIGPTGQLSDGPTVTLATSSTAFNGLTPNVTVTGSGDTLTFTSSLSGSLADAGVDNNLTISGGTIDNTPIGATTPSTAVFTNATTTSATTTNFYSSGVTRIGSLTGLLYGTSGVVSTATLTANDFNDSSGTISLDYANGQKASASVPGFLSSTDWSIFNNKISSTSLSATYPLAYDSSTGVFTTALSTTTSQSWSGTNTFNGNVTMTNATTSSFAISNLTNGRVPFATTGGALIDSSAFTFNRTSGTLATTYASTTAISATGSSYFATAGGRVGIGTTTPSWELHLDNTQDKGTYLNITNFSTGATAQAGIYGQSDTASYLSIAHGSGRTLNRYGFAVGGYAEMLQITGNGLLIGTGATTNPIVFGSNSTERLRITGTGLVGIGTSTPNANAILSTAGSAYIGGNLTATGTLNVSGATTLASSLTGFLYGTAGAVSASTTIGVPSGGTGSTTLTGLLKGNGTGSIQTAVAGTDYVAPGTVVSSIQQTYGSAQTGAITLATSTATTFNGLTISNAITNSGGTFTFAPNTITGTLANAGLANSTVSYGGVTLSLGGTDATPAFNLVDATGLPISTGVAGLGTGVATFLATPSSANLATALTDETGSGALVFGTNATLASTTLTGNTVMANATTSTLGITSVTSSLLKTGSTGGVIAAVAGTDYESPLTFTYPLTRSTNTISLAFGTTTNNTWSGTNTFNGNTVLTHATATSLYATTLGLNSEYFTDLTGSGLALVSGALSLDSAFDKGFFFSTTSADYWKTQRNFFSTTSADYWITQTSIEALSDVAAMTENYGDLLFWNGTAWADLATSSLGLGTISAIGPAGQTADGPTVTLATSSSAFNGLTPNLVITGSGDTLTYTSSLSGSLADAGVDNNLTISGGTIGSNSISGTLTTTGTLTIGDGGDDVVVNSADWSVSSAGAGSFAALTIPSFGEALLATDGAGGFTSVSLNPDLDYSASVLGINFAQANTWLALQTFSSGASIAGGTLSGTFAGSPTLSGTPLFTGGIVVNAASSTITNLVATNATTTNLAVSSLTSGRVPYVTTGGRLIDSANLAFNGTTLSANALSLTTALPVTSGGTGWGNIQANAVLYGNGTGALATTSAGTNGYVLALVSGTPTWVATSSINNGVTSIQHAYGSPVTGAITLATSTSGTDFSITNFGNNFLFDLPTASASARGALSSTDWSTFNNKVSSTSIDSLAEIETLTGVTNILIENDIDASSELAAIMDDETGSGALVFGTSATLASTTLTGFTALHNATSSQGFYTTNFGINSEYITDLTGNGLTITSGALSISTTSLSSGFFLQNGNSFGATAVLGTNDANNLAFEIGGTSETLLTSSAFSPNANDGNALGTTALGWSDLHLATGGVINWANGEVTITETDANTLTIAGASAVSLGTSAAFTTGTIELGAASDTTLSRSAAGILAVEGVDQVNLSATQTLTNKTLTSPTIGGSPTASGATWSNLGTVTTADINGGTIDGTVIGGSSAAAGTFTTLTATGNTTLAHATATSLYATTIGANSEYLTDFTGNGLTITSGALSISTTSLSSGFFLQNGNSFGATAVLGTNDANNLAFEIGGTSETLLTSSAFSPFADDGSALGTSALGWQGLFLDTGATINIENGDWLATHTAGILTVGTGDLRVTTAGTNSASVVTVGGTQTLTNKTLTSPTIGGSPTAAGATWTNLGTVTTADINGGTIDGTVIGGSSAAAGTFTTLTATGNTTLAGATSTSFAITSIASSLLKTNANGSVVAAVAGTDYLTSSTAFVQNGNSFGAATVLGTNDANTLAFETAGTSRMTITTAGNVGINAAASTRALEIASTSQFSIADVGNSDTLFVQQSGGTAAQDAYGASIAFSKINSSRRGAAIASVQTTSDVDQLGLAFFTHASAATSDALSEAMRITAGGAVGIGTTSPYGIADIWNSGGRFVTFASNGRNVFATNDNTVAPSLSLQNTMEAAGQGVSLSFNLGYGGTGNVEGTAVSGARLSTIAENTFTSTASTQDATLQFSTVLNGSLTEAMRLTSAGLVGIGTTTPGYKLQVAADNTGLAPQLAITGATNANAGVSLGYNTAGGVGVLGAFSNISALTGTSLLINPVGGNVGIGTTTFGATLTVGGTAFVGGAVTATSTVTGTAFIPTGSASGESMYLRAASTLGWSIGGTGETQLTSTAFSPFADDGSALGTTALGWSDLFLASGGTIHFANTDWVATHTTGILTVGTGDLRVTSPGVNSASVVTVGATQTLTNKTLTSPVIVSSPTASGATWTDLGSVTTIDINGGTIDGTNIGASSAGTGRFTTLTATGNTTLANATSTGFAISTIASSLLKTNASGSIIAAVAGTDYVAGSSGSANRVAYWSSGTTLTSSAGLTFDGSDLAVDTDTLFVDASANAVGAGTTTPDYALTVGGPLMIDHSNATYDVWIQGGYGSSGDTRNLALLGNASSDDLLLNYNTEYDCVSIGGTSCTEALDVTGTGQFSGALDAASLTLTTELAVAEGGTGATTLTDGGILLGSGTDAITAMAVLGNGAIVVGDGTTDPVALTAFTSSTGDLIHEAGGLEADVSGYTNGLYGQLSGATADIDTEAELETALGGIDITDSTDFDTCAEFILLVAAYDTGTCGNLVFSASPTLTGTVTAAAITMSGNLTVDTNTLFVDATGDQVGIGTAAPDEALHVAGNALIGSLTTYDAPGTGDAFLHIGENLAGATTPNGELILGHVLSSVPDDVIGQISFYSSDATTNATGKQAAIKAITEGATGATAGLAFFTGNGVSGAASTNERMRIDNTGSIGFGTSSPDYLIHQYVGAAAASLTANSASDDFVIESNTNAGISFLTPDASNSAIYFGSASDTTGTQMFWNHDANLFTLRTAKASAEVSIGSGNAVEAIRIDAAGQVGIGTSTPGRKLSVQGSANIAGDLWTSNLTATGTVTLTGGNLVLGTNSITMTGSIGTTGARVTKGWFTDLEVTNAIAGSITGNAGSVTFQDAAADTTTFVALGTAATGNLPVATDAGLSYNASTNALTVGGSVTLSGTDNVILGSNYLSGDGGDEGLSVQANGNASASGAFTAEGNLLSNGTQLVLDGFNAIQFNDTWLRLNNDNDFTSGIYLGTGLVYSNGSLQIGATPTFSISGTAASDVTLGAGTAVDFTDEVGDKLLLYSNTYGVGIEGSTLTNWSASQFRWRIGGTSVSGGTDVAVLSSGGNLQLDGSLDVGSQLLGNAADTTAAPSISWTGDTNTGMYRHAADQIGFSLGGVSRLVLGASGAITASSSITASSFIGPLTGNASTVTFADAASDTTTFVALGTAATGSLAPATDAGLAYNASTNDLTVTGAVDVGTQLLGNAADTAAVPSISWTGDTNTGMYRPAADQIGFTQGGVSRLVLGASGAISASSTLTTGGAITATTGDINATAGDFYAGAGNVRVNSGDDYGKYCMWGAADATYCIGMYSAHTLGYLNDYAMTFTMNATANRGWLWRDSSDTAAQGAMSLTTDGRLYVSSTAQFGAALEIGAATDTTLSRSAAGMLAIEGVDIVTLSASQTLTGKTLTSPTIGGSPSASGATWSNLGAVTTIDINGGTIDGTNIGASSAGTGSFTTLAASGNLTLSGTAANIILGSNFLSGDGGDEGISVDSSGNVTMSGNLTVDTSTLFVDAANNRVGIGSTSPNTRLSLGTGGIRASILADEGIVFDAGTAAGIGSFMRNTTVAGANDMAITGRTGIGFNGNVLTYDQVATSYQMYLTSAGSLGIGTTAPSRALDVWGASAGTTVTSDANPSIVVTNSNTTNNNYASFVLSGINSSNVQFTGAKMSAIFTDHTAASEDADIAFLAKSGSTMGEKMRISSTGRVGIGDATPTEGTLVVGNAGAGNIYATFASAGTNQLCWDNSGASLITACTSLAKYKDNVTDISMGLDTIRQLRAVEYDWNISDHQHDLGFIAEEVAAVAPLIARFDQDGLGGVKYDKITALLTKGIQELDLRTRFASSTASGISLTVASSTGNIAVGTTTSNLYKLAVGGDIAATGYVNLSTETSKTNIKYLTASSTEDILSDIGALRIATYRYKSENPHNPLRLGLIAEEAPTEVLSVDGKGVDIYKLATFSLAGVQALALKLDATVARVDSLEERIARLESGAVTIGSGTPAFSTTTLAAAFEQLGITLRNGFMALDTLVTKRFVVASDEEGKSPAGSGIIREGSIAVEIENMRMATSSRVFVTMTSEVDGSWSVTDKDQGSFTLGLAKVQDHDVTFDYFIVETEGGIEEDEGTQIGGETDEDEDDGGDQGLPPQETPEDELPEEPPAETPPADGGAEDTGGETGTGGEPGGEAPGESDSSGSEGGSGESSGESSGGESGGSSDGDAGGDAGGGEGA